MDVLLDVYCTCRDKTTTYSRYEGKKIQVRSFTVLFILDWGASSSEKRPDTNKRWFTRVVDVQQVTVEIQVGVLAHLHRRIGRFLGHGAGRESQLGIDGEWREGHFR